MAPGALLLEDRLAVLRTGRRGDFAARTAGRQPRGDDKSNERGYEKPH
jgi:hypothetical protein